MKNLLSNNIKKEMRIFQKKYSQHINSDVPLLRNVIDFIIKNKGKQIRPQLLILLSKGYNSINEETYISCVLIETLHNATLLHDDVVDNSNFRRGVFSINSIWKNKIAVLVGDYLLAKGVIISSENDKKEHLNILSNTVKTMIEGELIQLKKNNSIKITEKEYLKIIDKKTGSLFCACGKFIALNNNLDTEEENLLKIITNNIGIIFQIKDDLLDFEKSIKKSKVQFIDIINNQITLPIIYVLQNSKTKKKKILKNLLKKDNKNYEIIENIYKIIIEEGGISYTENKISSLKEKTFILINKLSLNNKDEIKNIINLIINRKT